MTAKAILNFIRFKVLYISTKYIWFERNMLNQVDSPFADLPGMISNQIRNFCYHYGKNVYTGEGCVVDLGPWLGASVVPLAAGLKANERARDAIIHAFDAFVWYENMNYSLNDTSVVINKYRVGECFEDEFKKQTAAYAKNISIHVGDIMEASWQNGAIEYLMVDAMKDWDLAKHIVQTFYPQLIPNKSIVIQEDFCHHYTSWIHLIHYRLKDYFEPTDDLKHSRGVAFRCIKALPKDSQLLPAHFADFTNEEIEKAFAYSSSLVSWRKQAPVKAAKIMAYRHKGDYNTAKKLLANVPWAVRYFDFEMKEAVRELKRYY